MKKGKENTSKTSKWALLFHSLVLLAGSQTGGRKGREGKAERQGEKRIGVERDNSWRGRKK